MSATDPAAPEATSVAIACQGGGSHAAFTAGALQTLLRERPPSVRYLGFSGASGGGICAATAWYGVLSGGPERAAELLDDLWADVAATSPTERVLNAWGLWYQGLLDRGFPVPELSPHSDPLARLGQSELRRILRRHLDFAAIPQLVGPAAPRLLVSAVDVERGAFVTFEGEELTADHLLASAAHPAVFPSVTIDGVEYWDGLYSQNPPIADFLDDVPSRADKPDELWIVQLAPRTSEPAPRSLRGIVDRRTELAGNLSLHQEVRFVEQVNEWIAAGRLDDDRYKQVTVRWLRPERDLPVRSERDTDPEFLHRLQTAGRRRAREFLASRFQPARVAP